MKLLITGATGFLGRHLVRQLHAEGHELLALKRRASRVAAGDAASYFDIEDGLDQPFKKAGRVDAVVHLATDYGRGNASFADVSKANVSFPLELLDLALAHGCRRFLNTDTFISSRALTYRYLGAYALSKKHFAEWGRLRTDSPGELVFCNLQLEHIYGPGDAPTKFVSQVLEACLRSGGEMQLTEGRQVRDFIYVSDVVSAYAAVLLAELTPGFHQFEVGTGAGVSIFDFVNALHRQARSSTRLIFGALPYREGELMSSVAQIEALRALGWQAKVGLASGIERIIEDFRS